MFLGFSHQTDPVILLDFSSETCTWKSSYDDNCQILSPFPVLGNKSFYSDAWDILFSIIKQGPWTLTRFVVFLSGFVRLAGGARPCSGRVEVHSEQDWIPVSDRNFALPTAQVICAELGCGKAVSVLGHVPFRESDGQVWAEEFRCEGKEPELWSCPRMPCPGGTCHHSGAAQVVCSGNIHVRT